MYGGRDFQSPTDLTSPSSSPVSSPHTSAKESSHLRGTGGQSNVTQDHFYNRTRQAGLATGRTKTSDYATTSPSSSPRQSSLSSPKGGRSSNGSTGRGKKQKGKRHPSDWRVAGGPGRDHSVLMELELDKVRKTLHSYVCNKYLGQVERVSWLGFWFYSPCRLTFTC